MKTDSNAKCFHHNAPAWKSLMGRKKDALRETSSIFYYVFITNLLKRPTQYYKQSIYSPKKKFVYISLLKGHHEKALKIFIASFIMSVLTSFNDFYIFVLFNGQNRQSMSY